MVVSALAGVTDLLLEATPQAADTFRRKHRQAARTALGSGPALGRLLAQIDASAREYRDVCAAIQVLGHLSARVQDSLVARGEQLSAAILAATITRARRRAAYVDALDVIRTDEVHGGAAPLLDETVAQARKSASAARRRRHGRRGARLHRPRARRQPDDARPRRYGPDRHAAGAIASRPSCRVVEGRARHPHRRSAARAGCARDPAAASSRSRRGGALRREGAAPARADPDRRHAHHAARPVVHRSGAAGHGSIGAAVAEGAIR